MIDDNEGWRRATILGLRTVGVIGVLIVARQSGGIQSLSHEIGRLRREAGFFVDVRLESQALAMVGE